MELRDDHRHFYHRDPACGTIHIKIDSKDDLMFSFTERIELEILFTSLDLTESTSANPPQHENITREPVEDLRSGHDVYQKSDSDTSGDVDESPDVYEDKLVVDLSSKLCSPWQIRRRSPKKKSTLNGKNFSNENSVPNQDEKGECASKGEENSTSIKQELSSRAIRYKKRKSNERKESATESIRLTKKVKNSTNNDPNQGDSKTERKGTSGVLAVAEKRTSKCRTRWQTACAVSCQYCLKEFPNQQAFYDHKKTARSLLFPCGLCQKIFPFKAYLQAHLKACHSEKKEFANPREPEACVCDTCGVEVKNMFALKKHLMSHTDEYFYKCCICGKQFVEPGTLNNHMATHKSGGMIRCKCCNQLFATRGSLAKHKLALMEVKCHLCGQTFPNRTSRTQHYKISHQTDILKCVQCTSMFSSSEELSVHMKKHTIYKKKQCTTCGKFFSRLEKHVITHKSKSDIDESDLFVCDKCPGKFSNRSSFQRHLSIHSAEKPYQCPNCPRTFADCGVLRKHLRRHSLLMPYQCEVCGKKCKESGNLKVHMRIHSDTKKFPCPSCPLAFNYKSSLDGHVRTQHPPAQLSGAQTVGPDPGFKCDLQVPFQNRLKASENSGGQTLSGSGRDELVAPGEKMKVQMSGLEVKTEQRYASRQDADFKQYCEGRADTLGIKQTYCEGRADTLGIKQAYSEGSVNPIKHTYNGHSAPATADCVPRVMYMGGASDATKVNMTSAYVSSCNSAIMNIQNQTEMPDYH